MLLPSKSFIHTVVVAALLITMFTACTSVPTQPASVTRGDYASTTHYLTRRIAYEMRKHDITGLSIAVVDDQNTVWEQGFGFADKAAGRAALPGTVYRTGSISKLFTNAAVMQLAEQGKVDIDQPLQTYLPAFSIKTRFAQGAPVTPRNIMTHHAGLPDNLLNGMWVDKPAAFSTVTMRLRDDYAAYPPNTIFAYSNVGITLLGDMIQTVTGRAFSSYLDASLLQPMGMTHSAFSTGLDGSLASKSYKRGIEAVETPLRDVPAGGLNSTVSDLGRFMQMVFADGRSQGRQILRPAALAEMLRPQNEGLPLDQDFRIGLGWMFNSEITDAGRVVQHSGATMHHRSKLILAPDHKVGVVVLSNSYTAGAAVNDIADAALKLAIEVKTGNKAVSRPATVTRTPAEQPVDARAWPGSYVTAVGYASVALRGERLEAELFGKSFQLTPREDGQLGLTYRLLGVIPIQPDQLADIGMTRQSIAGRDVLIMHRHGVKSLVAEKIIPQPVSAQWLSRLGAYDIVNAEGDGLGISQIQLVQRDGFLMFTVSVASEDNTSLTVPVMPVSETQAVILGLGRSKGETIHVVSIAGNEHVMYSGYLLRKKAQ